MVIQQLIMAQLTFETLSFHELDQEIEVGLLRHFSLKIPKEELEKIGFQGVKDHHTLLFKGEQEKAEVKFSFLLEKYLDTLTTKLTGNKAYYIHQNSGIPLMGNVAFGIVYRNSSLIEIKPQTFCNLNCVYCSISEGIESKKNDFVVEKDYLLAELDKVIDFVGESVEVHIGVQGEPFLYAPMPELISDLQQKKNIHTISMDTNGILLSKELIDKLTGNDKLQLNISLDAIDEHVAKKVVGMKNFNQRHLLDMITYASGKVNLLLAPVLVPGYNEQEMEKIISYAKTLRKMPKIGIQNYLSYKTGRHPVKPWTWEKFFAFIDELEKKCQLKLRLSEDDFGIHKTKELPKPFVVGEVVSGIVKCPDRFANSSLAVAKGRTISIPACAYQKGKNVKVRIIRDKHNIFVGKLV